MIHRIFTAAAHHVGVLVEVSPEHPTDLADSYDLAVEAAALSPMASMWRAGEVDLEAHELGVTWMPCNCESSHCTDHGDTEADWHECPHPADPRFDVAYVGQMCTRCVASMGATGGVGYLALAETVEVPA